MNDDLNTPAALAAIETALDAIEAAPLERIQHDALTALVEWIDNVLGMQLALSTPDIHDNEKQLILERERARENKDWARSDQLRDELAAKGITLRDTARHTIWTRNET